MLLPRTSWSLRSLPTWDSMILWKNHLKQNSTLWSSFSTAQIKTDLLHPNPLFSFFLKIKTIFGWINPWLRCSVSKQSYRTEGQAEQHISHSVWQPESLIASLMEDSSTSRNYKNRKQEELSQLTPECHLRLTIKAYHTILSFHY